MDSSSSQPEKKSIPRFASFKPRPAPPPEADRPPDRRSRDSSEKEGRHGHHSKRQRSRHGHRRERSRSRDRRRERKDTRHGQKEAYHSAREPVPEHRPATHDTVKLGEASDLYVVDRKGDQYNIIYGTIHRYNVPLYHRIGRGSVLGLPPTYKIDRDTTEGDALIIKADAWRSDGSRARSKSIISGLSPQKTKLLRIRPASTLDAAADASKDYLPLTESVHQKRGDVSGDDGSDDEKYGYRSIHGKAKHEDNLPSDMEEVSDTDLSGDEAMRVDPDKEIKQRNVELSRNVDRNPTDVRAWIDLVEYQEFLLKGSEGGSKSLTYAEKKSLADIKISLYEKALKKVGGHTSRDILLLGLLEEGAKLWDTKKLSARWQATLKSNPHFISLWVKYLDFRQTEFLDFTFERCYATFIDCMRLNKSASDNPENGHVQAYLFLRLTLFIREAGFVEHAIGLWQAILELTFFQSGPMDSATAREEVLSAFTDFWDSEVMRIGEVGAKGWQSDYNTLLEPRSFTPQNRVDPKSIFASWMACERERICNARLPARSLDEEDDDPYRVILSTDLQEVLSLVWGLASTDVLIDSFLYFCHLPPIAFSNDSKTTNQWMGDSFLRNEFMSSSDSTLDRWVLKYDTDTRYTASVPSYFQNFVHSFDTLFADHEAWFSSIGPWATAVLNTQSDVDPAWVSKVLRSLVEVMPRNDHLAAYAIAVEYTCDRKKAAKYAKSLLKKRPSSLWLYNVYALIECRSGNLEAANRVWETTLSMSQNSRTFSEGEKADTVLLWHTCIWEMMEAGSLDYVSYLFNSMPQSSPSLKAPVDPKQNTFSPTSLLKTHSLLSDSLETLLAAGKANAFMACTDCLAILAYLSNSRDLNKALQQYSNTFSRLATLPAQFESFRSVSIELLHQARARLLYYHARTSSIYKPSQIRALLADSISLFPHNTIFLSLFAWNESRFRIEERVRDTIMDITTKANSCADHILTTQVPITSHLFSIFTELNRPVYSGSTPHSVRAAFEKAIGDQDPSNSTQHSTFSTARSNLTLWKLYILFELSQHDINRAKEVFYRGMRACPWSKELIMLAFSHLGADIVREKYPSTSRKGDGMNFFELRNVYNVLIEKELRVHVDIEDELDELVAEMQQKTATSGLPIAMPEDADSEDERMQL
ncbi:NRDE-2, necessary for RNA interference-domain-containing protein [Aspergillus bertholletiae]|uniref:NRDE-2, necessary for RNA interference-domain-containing protein n=1 Tax=Aspergillus bertholletiae TaxID=1226010 RepID=A0A5N7BDV6_9EURO|nr:NRDE-2, necessary for RNA interference-domain-containing protein [Aspergillus bertholletiae]